MTGVADRTGFRSAYEALAAAVSRNPGKTAMRFEEEEFSYARLLDRVDNAARRLMALGIDKGAAFAAYSQNRPEMILCYYAASRLGAVFVPLNPNLTAPEVAYSFKHSGAAMLLHDDVVAEAARQAVPADRLLPISTIREPAAADGGAGYPVIDPSADFVVIYTSGSTGTPKAIVLDHAAQLDVAASLTRMWGISDADVTLVGLPLGYLYGLSTAAAVGLQAGGLVVILRRFHPRDALEALVAHKATVYHGVPTMFSMMLEYCEQRGLGYDLSAVRELICAGAPLPDEMRQRFAQRFGKSLDDYYAMTECTPVFGKYYDDPRPVPARAIGRLAPSATAKIVRADGSECDIGEEGEILVRAAATLKRYHGDPGLTAESMRDGLFRSGDLGYRDRDGYYYISGRIKDVIIRGGANISPSEVERVLATHSGVQDAAVIGAPDRIFGEVPVAFIVRRHGSQVVEDELIRHVETSLSDFKVPRRYVFLAELPQGKTGKVDKAELKRRLAAMVP